MSLQSLSSKDKIASESYSIPLKQALQRGSTEGKVNRTPPSSCLCWRMWGSCVSICGFSQRPSISSKQNTMAAEKGAALCYLCTTGTWLLLKPHSWLWAIWRALSISVLPSARQSHAPWVLEHTSLAKELDQAQRTVCDSFSAAGVRKAIDPMQELTI